MPHKRPQAVSAFEIQCSERVLRFVNCKETLQQILVEIMLEVDIQPIPNPKRFAEAKELFEPLVQSSDTALADAARQRIRMCERRIAEANST